MTTKKDPIYKRTQTGATQIWWMEIDGARYRTHSGQVGGAITTSAWTVCKGKNVGRANETSAEQQAELEVEAAYRLKRKKDYHDTIEGAQGSTKFKCMLAEKYYEQKPKLVAPNGRIIQYDLQRDHMPGVYLQPKLDGIRCIVNAQGMWSRDGNQIVSAPHIFKLLQPILAKRPNLIFDGELYNHDLKEDFNEIVSIVKKLKPTEKDLQRSAEMAQYWVYDGLIEDRSERFYIRFVEDIAPIVRELGPMITDVPTDYATDVQQIDAIYEDYLLDGFEGGMIRRDLPYEPGKRSKTLLKRKEFQDAEFQILRIEEGVGNGAGLAKRAYVRLPNGGECKVDVVGTRQLLTETLARKDELVGKMATIEFQNYTPDGSLRFPKLKVIHNTPRW